MKLKHLIDPVAVDMDTLLRVKAPDLDRSELTTSDMYVLMRHVSIQRAYDDSHIGFQTGIWERILPFDGRDYCFYYGAGFVEKLKNRFHFQFSISISFFLT